MGVTVESYTVNVELDYDGLLEEIAIEGAKEVKNKAPVRTGSYKSDIAGTVKKGTAYVYVRPPHYRIAHILEFGTTGPTAQGKQPHFTPAFKDLEPLFVELMKEVDIKEK